MGRRQAQVWKKQQDMTNLGEGITDKEKLQEKLRVKIALQMMRKAHVTGSSADRTRVKLHRLAEGDIHAFDRKDDSDHQPPRKKKKKVRKQDKDQDKDEHILETEPFKVRTLNEIMQDARESYLIKRDKIKMENESKKYGQLRPICPALIEELKQERLEELREAKKKEIKESHQKRQKPRGLLAELAQRRGSTLNEISDSLEDNSTPMHDDSLYSESLQKASREPSTFKISEGLLEIDEEEERNWREHIKQQKPHSLLFSRPDSIPANEANEGNDPTQQGLMRRNRETFIIPQQRPTLLINTNRRPISANGALEIHRSQSIPDEMNDKDDAWVKEAVEKAAAAFHQAMNEQAQVNQHRRPTSAQPYSRKGSSSAFARSGSQDFGYGRRTVSFSSNFQNDNDPRSSHPSSPSHRDGSFTAPNRSSSVIMKAPTLEEDVAIIKAMKKRDSQIQLREEILTKKINERDQLAQTKLQYMVQQERQKAWLAILALQLRSNYLKQIITQYRSKKAWEKTNTKIKKAVKVIKKWWKKQAVILFLARNPKVKDAFRRFFVRQIFKMKYRKKKRSADLILMFLRESSMISESMRKIYAFRQDVIKIQRFIRSWFDAQQYRVRLLWLAGEKIARQISKEERIAKLKNEKSSMNALQSLSGFANSVTEINTVRKKISKVLEYQDEARKNREDLFYEVLRVETKLSQQDYISKSREPSPNSLSNKKAGAGSPNPLLANSRGRVRPQSANAAILPNNLSAGNSLTNLTSHNVSIASQGNHDLPRKFSNIQNGFVNPLASSNNLAGIASGGNRRMMMSPSSHNLGSRTMSSNPSAYGSYQARGRRGGRLGDIGANAVFLGLSERCGNDASMQQWYRRIRNTPNGLRLFDTLRTILSHQRRRHIIQLSAHQNRRKICPVEIQELQKFLKDPKDFSLSHNISHTIGGIDHTQAIAIDHKSSPFLLLTQGGLEQVEMVVRINKNIRF